MEHQNKSKGEGYWIYRSKLMYYQYIDFMVKALAFDAKSLLDVGSSDAEYIESFNWIADRTTIDLNKPYCSANVKGIQLNFMDFHPTIKYDFVTCFQVLEHIPNPTAFAQKLLDVGKRLLISVPYMWDENSEQEHIHDPIDLEKVVSWFGKKPDYHIIVQEPLFNSSKNKRLICYFHCPNEKTINFNKLRQNALKGDITVRVESNDMKNLKEELYLVKDHLEKMSLNLNEILKEQQKLYDLYITEIKLRNKRDELSNIRVENKQLMLEIEGFKEEINKYRNMYQQTLRQKKKVKTEYTRILNSRSWRYTKPLRLIKSKIKRK